MRSYGPPVAAGARRAPPLELSAVAHRGVTEALRAALAVIDAARAGETKQAMPAPAWTA
jgi:hypothetical protein